MCENGHGDNLETWGHGLLDCVSCQHWVLDRTICKK